MRGVFACAAGGKGDSAAAGPNGSLAHMMEHSLSVGAATDSSTRSDEWRDSLQPLGAPRLPT
jgi:hypothetical protein